MVNGLADADGILRDGPCREIYFRHRVLGIVGLERLFDALNDRYFGGRLTCPVLVLSASLEDDVVGCLDWESEPKTLYVDLGYYNSGYEEARDILLHEMCHLYIREVCGDVGEVSHTAGWFVEAIRVGIDITDGCDG